MTQPTQQVDHTTKYPPLLIGASVCAIVGVCVAFLGVFLDVEPDTVRGIMNMGTGMVSFGVGEFLNHRPQPPPPHLEKTHKQLQQNPLYERTPCTLGNLLVIFSMLIFFLGLGKIISF